MRYRALGRHHCIRASEVLGGGIQVILENPIRPAWNKWIVPGDERTGEQTELFNTLTM